MEAFKQEFIRLAIESQVLSFGEFELKSGRSSPYFFNMGKIASGKTMASLGDLYAQAIIASGVEYDVLFGPAYKGIPLVTAVAVALAARDIDAPFAFNRKEVKAHGEGGQLVGAPLQGKVLVLDDVLTAGTALRESIHMIKAAGAEPVGAMLALNRQEIGPNGGSTTAELRDEYGLQMMSLVTLAEVIEYLKKAQVAGVDLEAIEAYRKEYGCDE